MLDDDADDDDDVEQQQQQHKGVLTLAYWPAWVVHDTGDGVHFQFIEEEEKTEHVYVDSSVRMLCCARVYVRMSMYVCMVT